MLCHVYMSSKEGLSQPQRPGTPWTYQRCQQEGTPSWRWQRYGPGGHVQAFPVTLWTLLYMLVPEDDWPGRHIGISHDKLWRKYFNFFFKLALSVSTPWALWCPCLFLPFHFMFNISLYKPTFLIWETHWHLCVICSCRYLHVHKSKILGQNWFQWPNFWLAGAMCKGIHCERNRARYFINAISPCRHLSGLLACKDLSSQETDMRRNYLLTPLGAFCSEVLRNCPLTQPVIWYWIL